MIRLLDQLLADARSARGDARAAIVEKLQMLNEELMRAAQAEADAELTATLSRDADAELVPFKARMPPAEFARARAAALDRLLRDALGLPLLTYE